MSNQVSAQWIDLAALQSIIEQLGLAESYKPGLHKVCSVSCSAMQWLEHDPDLLNKVLANDAITKVFNKRHFLDIASTYINNNMTEADLMVSLRALRQWSQLRFIWREVNGLASITDSIREISFFADVVIDLCLQWVEHHMRTSVGIPIGKESGKEQRLCVLGMGKLGALELNLSSDVDLIFVYPEAGETQGGRRCLSNQEFFIRVGRKLIGLLDTVTADGFVFRVDMRLRPYGGSGALAANFDAMQIYYQEQGREWERYALIKARPIAGDIAAGEELMSVLRPFIYRKYVDYSVIESLRGLKQSINAEVKRKGMESNLKLGKGGIREIEFIVQVFQLIYGGSIGAMRRRSLINVMPVLLEQQYLTAKVIDELTEAYLFLRQVEHAVMMYEDKQTHQLPDSEQARQALLVAMGYSCWQSFAANLSEHRARVQSHFDAVVAASEKPANEAVSLLWPITLKQDEAVLYAQKNGFTLASALVDELQRLDQSSRYQNLDQLAKDRLDELLPLLLKEVSAYKACDELMQVVLRLIDTILRRSSYMVLLLENEAARQLLLELMAKSSWVTKEVIDHPVLLNELIKPDDLYRVPTEAELRKQLDVLTSRVAIDDLEEHMNILRRFRRSHMLRAAVSELSELVTLMKVSDYLALLASIVIEHALAIAYQHLLKKHGILPGCDIDVKQCGFAVVGYGKLGGLELSHTSDLDLVFIFSVDKLAESNGKTPITAQQFYARLAQRLIHILSTATTEGALYEIDMRLRPSGNSGAVVSSIQAFTKYQQEAAWTWEHQALMRARGVAGDTQALHLFKACRDTILCMPRDTQTLLADVINMRQKMRDNLLDASMKGDKPSEFHIKHSSGGIVDIEFMVQCAVLAFANNYPVLAAFPDNIRTLETLGQLDLMTVDQTTRLISAYKAYRSAVHTLSLQDKSAVVPVTQFESERQSVNSIWQEFLATIK